MYLRLNKDQLEEAKKSPKPTASVLIAAKGRDIDMQWSHVAEALLHVGEYELAKSICDKEGELVSVCVGLCLCACVRGVYVSIPVPMVIITGKGRHYRRYLV